MNLVLIDFRLNYLMAGLSPMWYHATNVALHAGACILVTRVSLVVAALRPGFAALAGLLFATHPVHTEAVSDMRDILKINKCNIFYQLIILRFKDVIFQVRNAGILNSVCSGDFYYDYLRLSVICYVFPDIKGKLLIVHVSCTL